MIKQWINNRSWMTRARRRVQSKGVYTFQRLREDGIQRSVIDYGIVDSSLKIDVLNFEVRDDSYIDSDHHPIVMELEACVDECELQEDHTGKKVNWSKYSQVVD